MPSRLPPGQKTPRRSDFARKDKSKSSSSAALETQMKAAQYIAQMAAELATIAETAQLDLLSYFLKMAQIEAEDYLRAKK